MNSRRFLFCIIPIAALFATNLAVAQQTSDANGVPVQMIVTVEPRHGSDVPNVNREDVMVYEGKDRDQVTNWVAAQGDRAGLDLFILIDDSSSPTLTTQFDDIRKFISAQPSTTKVGIAYMQNGIARIEQDLTSDHDLAAKALRIPMGFAGANSSPYFSLNDLIKRWPKNADRHEVLMVSNGIDLYYGVGDMLDPYLSAAIADSARAAVIVSSIYAPGAGHSGHSYWLNYWGQMYLAQLTEETGGEAYYIGFQGPAVNFTPYLNDMSNRLNHQYWLTFLAKPQKKSGMQPVKLRTELPNVELVSADRVYVPASQ